MISTSTNGSTGSPEEAMIKRPALSSSRSASCLTLTSEPLSIFSLRVRIPSEEIGESSAFKLGVLSQIGAVTSELSSTSQQITLPASGLASSRSRKESPASANKPFTKPTKASASSTLVRNSLKAFATCCRPAEKPLNPSLSGSGSQLGKVLLEGIAADKLETISMKLLMKANQA